MNVRHYHPNAWCLYDLIGNELERVEDTDPHCYPSDVADESAAIGDGNTRRMRRGGLWLDTLTYEVGSSHSLGTAFGTLLNSNQPKENMKRILLLLLLTLLTALSYGAQAQSSTTPAKAQSKGPTYQSFLNQKAPEFVVEKWLSEKPELAGKFLLIEFWATWCGPCHAVIKRTSALQPRFKDRMAFIALSDEAEEVVRNHNFPPSEYFSAIDTQARMKNALGIKALPHTLIVDPQGVVRWEGFLHLHSNLLKNQELVEKLLAELIAKYGQ